MALLNGLYINVVDESIEDDVEVTSHPVEQGGGHFRPCKHPRRDAEHQREHCQHRPNAGV